MIILELKTTICEIKNSLAASSHRKYSRIIDYEFKKAEYNLCNLKDRVKK